MARLVSYTNASVALRGLDGGTLRLYSETEPTRFTGQETDLNAASGQIDDLVYMHARYYNPVIARFLSPDVLAGRVHAPQSFNLFAYVRDNPTNYWDPWGMSDKTFGGTIVVRASDPWSEFFYWYFVGGPDYTSWHGAADEGGGGGDIMARLARQPRVGDMNDVLRTMNSFECDATWNRVFRNMAETNSLGLRVGGFKLFGPRNAAVSVAGQIVGSTVPQEFGLPTLRQFVIEGGLRGMVIEGASFTGVEAGVLTAAGMGLELGLTQVAWQAGVFAGSIINVAVTAPCHYGE